MSRLVGHIFLWPGLLCCFFLMNYSGTFVPLKWFWFVLSVSGFFLGVYFLARSKSSAKINANGLKPKDEILRIESLKQNGEKIRITLANAQIKSRSFQQEVANEELPSRVEVLDGLYDGSRNHKTNVVQQTYIVFYKQYNGKTYKFVSRPTTQDLVSIKMYIDGLKGVDLYVDLSDPTNYYYDLPYL